MLRICLIVICCLILWTSAISQRITRKGCRVGEAEFSCPKNFTRAPLEPASRFAIFIRNKPGVGLFVASPEPGFDEQRLIDEIIKATLARAFPKESLTFQWKRLKAMDHISRFESAGGVLHGFNGELLVQIKYRRIRVRDREFLIGYTAELGRGAQAKESLEIASGADSLESIAGCQAIVEIIYSITDEKIDRANDPCSLDVIAAPKPV